MSDTMIFTANQLDRFITNNKEVAKRVKIASFDSIGFDALIDGALERFDYPFSSGDFDEILGDLDTYEFLKNPDSSLREVAAIVDSVRYFVTFTLSDCGRCVEVDTLKNIKGQDISPPITKGFDRALECAILTTIEEVR